MMQDIIKQTLSITPIAHALNACVQVPGSKSQTNRALLVAALANGITRLNNALFSDDSLYFVNSLEKLGFTVNLNPQTRQMTINGLGGTIPAQQADLFIGNAGTAARFLTALLTLGHGQFMLDGEARMRERPIGGLVDALTNLGADITAHNSQADMVCPPLSINADGLSGGKTSMAGNISSQFLSALLMTAPYASSPVEITINTELNSKPYVDLTLRVMEDFGVKVERDGYKRFLVQPSQYRPLNTYAIRSDASAASYFFAAPAICGGTVKVENISRKSRQGDIQFVDVLAQMGCQVDDYEDSLSVTGPEQLKGVDVDMRDFPDPAQTLAVLAPFADSPTRIRGIASARVKETDRIAATCAELQRLGVQVEEHEDGMTIYPAKEIHPAMVHTYNDHRMAMAFSLIGLRVPGIVIENPSCVSKTFPNFFQVLDTLR